MPAVTATLATIPDRIDVLQKTVASLLPQVDRLCVYLNGFDRPPSFLVGDPRISVASSCKHGDLGDAGKFFWAGALRGLHFVCDDDIVYPPDYTRRMTERIERRSEPAIYGVHGFIFAKPFRSYFRSRQTFHATYGLVKPQRCHGLGTGTMAYDTSKVRLGLGDFPVANMADVWLAVAANRRRIPLWAVDRPRGWIDMQPTSDSIFDRTRRDCGHLDLVIGSEIWPDFS